MNIYPTSSTSQSPLSLKTNWTFKIAIQIIHQREWAEKIFESKQPQNKAEKVFSTLLQSIVLRQLPIASVQFFSNQLFVTNNCNVTTIDCNLLKKSVENNILKIKFLFQLFIKHLMIIDPIEHENSIKLWENSTNGIIKQCSMNQNQKSTRDHIVKDDDPTYQR